MLRVGQTESQPEEPEFLHLLSTLDEAKGKLKEIYNTSQSVASAGMKFNENLEKFCGFGIRNEDVFTKDAEFLTVLAERVCTALGRIVNIDINTLNEAIVQYKAAKLRFDALHYKTVKKMRKEGKTVTVENADDVMKANMELPALHKIYLVKKLEIQRLRDVIVSHLRTKVASRMEELRAVSNAKHHQLYCKYFEERLKKTAEICSEEPSEDVHILRRSNTFSHHRSTPGLQRKYIVADPIKENMNVAGNTQTSFSGGNGLRTDDEKGAEFESIKSTENLGNASTAQQKFATMDA